jgi:hypothetical protein
VIRRVIVLFAALGAGTAGSTALADAGGGRAAARGTQATAVTSVASTTTTTTTTTTTPLPPPKPSRARLSGQFQMAGRVLTAVNIRGEHKGQRVKRVWTFTPRCASGACRQIKLARQRAAGTDHLVLKRIRPAFYQGFGKFYAALRCAGRLYHRGESVPFRIQVRVTYARRLNGIPVATRIRAWYRNRVRHNLTNCIAIPGHDSAGYHGHLVLPSGGAGA